MTWEDVELAEYERRRAAKLQRDELSTQRNNLLEGRNKHEWMDLRSEVLKRFQYLNERSGRPLTESQTVRDIELYLRREDGEELRATYDMATKTVTFTSEAEPFAKMAYELVVRPIDGKDTLVWRTVDSKSENMPKEAIAKEIVTRFLRAGALL